MRPNVRRRLLRQLTLIDGLECYYCGLELRVDVVHTDFRAATIEHLIPRVVGGPDTVGNTRLACYQCNCDANTRFQLLCNTLSL